MTRKLIHVTDGEGASLTLTPRPTLMSGQADLEHAMRGVLGLLSTPDGVELLRQFTDAARDARLSEAPGACYAAIGSAVGSSRHSFGHVVAAVGKTAANAP